MVEGGRIDHGHHAGNAYRALTETIEFANAVGVAAEMTKADDTLILVTADHSHTLVFAGYPARGNPILGKVRGSSGEGAPSKELSVDATGLPYATLSYANGPGYAGASDRQPEGAKHYPHEPSAYSRAENGRPHLADVDTEAPDYEQESLMPLSSETHSGDDVAVYRARARFGCGARIDGAERAVPCHRAVERCDTWRALQAGQLRCARRAGEAAGACGAPASGFFQMGE